MSKRTQPDSARTGSQPPQKKARYTYNPELQQQRILPRTTTNSDEETTSEITNNNNNNMEDEKEEEDSLLLSTRKPITTSSSIKIESEIISSSSNKTESEWCPIQWFRNRAYHSDVNEFFNILPYEEAYGVTKRLIELNGGSITLSSNLLNILSKMEEINKYIENDISHSNNNNSHNKRKKRFIQKQNEIFNTINIKQLKKNNSNYINKLTSTINKLNNNNNKYISYENERKLIWKMDTTPTPPPINNKIQTKIVSINNNKIETENDSDTESDSDESFTILNDKKKKKRRKKKRKKSRAQKLEEEIERERQKEIEAAKQAEIEMYGENGGKNPVYADTQPQKFWNKFMNYFEPTNPNSIEEIIPYLQSDIFPTKIPLLPLEKTFITKSYNFDDINSSINMDDTLPSFDDINDIKLDENENNISGDNELYFAEMPKNYEYFLDKKCYIDEQINIENNKNNKYLNNKCSGMYKHYPYKSLYSHSFNQRTLSAIVHECDGLYNIEGNCDENNWKKIGSKKLTERRKKEIGKDKKKSNLNKKQHCHYENVEMIEPIIKYKNEPIINKEINFENALRNEICKYIYDGEINSINKIVQMPWNQRQDDECCTCIKSLDNNLEEDCFKFAPNDIDTNVKIGKEIVGLIRNKYDENINNYHSWNQFQQHINVIQKNHIDTRGEFVVDQETLNQPQWLQYFKQKEDIQNENAVDAFMQKDFVQTKQEE